MLSMKAVASSSRRSSVICTTFIQLTCQRHLLLLHTSFLPDQHQLLHAVVLVHMEIQAIHQLHTDTIGALCPKQHLDTHRFCIMQYCKTSHKGQTLFAMTGVYIYTYPALSWASSWSCSASRLQVCQARRIHAFYVTVRHGRS